MLIIESQEQDNQKPSDLKIFTIAKIVIYNIIFYLIYDYSINLLHKGTSYTGEYSNGGDFIEDLIYKANKSNATIALLLILIFSIIFAILYFRELHILEVNDVKIFKNVLLVVFEIEAILFSIFNLSYLYKVHQLFSELDLGSPILEFIRSVLVFAPPFVLILWFLRKPIKNFIDNYKE